MRIRQVKPSFFGDKAMGKLDDSTKLFYIGLWLQADDAGWLEWNEERFAAELYPYLFPTSRRETKITKAAMNLASMLRVIRFSCGHALIPSLTKHQRFGGPTKRVHTTLMNHGRCQNPVPLDREGEPYNGPIPSVNLRSPRVPVTGIGIGSSNTEVPIPVAGPRGAVIAEGVTRARELLADPHTPEVVKRAARKTIERYGEEKPDAED